MGRRDGSTGEPLRGPARVGTDGPRKGTPPSPDVRENWCTRLRWGHCVKKSTDPDGGRDPGALVGCAPSLGVSETLF